MKRFFALALLCSSALLVGCSGDPGKYPDPTEITGKVVGPSGAPLSGVKIFFQPTGNTPTAFAVVGNGGSFSSKAVAGEYVFYFEAIQPASEDQEEAFAAAFAAIPAKYREPNKDHTVKLEPGVEIKLNP